MKTDVWNILKNLNSYENLKFEIFEYFEVFTFFENFEL
jgi:hypothetical protein